jgi:UDP-N-acetylmuramoylalanine--D-glutamate ligase
MEIRQHPGVWDFTDKRVTVIGLGIEGVDLARYLSRRGALVTVSDSKPRAKLADRAGEVDALGVRLSLGSNEPRDIAEAEAVFVSQGVPLDLPGVENARQRGIPMYSMMGLFMELCPGPIAGITGSSGKTTTTALVGEMFEADERPVFVGGNIGVGLLDHLSSLRAYTWAVLEVSHTQLQLVNRSPHVAAILNITPNHLDRFSWDDYKQLKANLIRYQTASDIAVLGYDDAECRELASEVKGRLLWFTRGDSMPDDGVFVKHGWAVVRYGRLNERVFGLDSLRLRGRHNQANAVAAASIATACGVSPEAIACAVETFRGVPHRLEFVAEIEGVGYYNDSIATTPERALAAIRSFEEPAVLLLGGRDKNLPLEELASEAKTRCRAVVVFGESGGKLEDALRGAAGSAPVRRVEGLAEAVETARAQARAGDVVLLSPACTSYDAYESFEQRGEHFRSLLRAMEKPAAVPAGGGVQPSLR